MWKGVDARARAPNATPRSASCAARLPSSHLILRWSRKRMVRGEAGGEQAGEVVEVGAEAGGDGLLPGELEYQRELAATKAGAVELSAEDAEALLWIGQGLATGKSMDVPSFLEGVGSEAAA